jgi:hypothetical protein
LQTQPTSQDIGYTAASLVSTVDHNNTDGMEMSINDANSLLQPLVDGFATAYHEANNMNGDVTGLG